MLAEQTTEDLLTLENPLVRADTGKRFLNYVIDLIFFYILLILVGILIAVVSPSSLGWLEDDSPGFALTDRVITLVMYAVYMSVIETVFKGKSLGKLVTGTRAVNMDGTSISSGTAFARGFSRAVPFCAFSCFGTPCNPWQDRWTDTMVIDVKKSEFVYSLPS